MDRPFIHINAALWDGPESGPASAFAGEISCAADWARVHLLREKYDGVAVGGRTWNQDRPRLTVRADRLGREPCRQPARVIFAGRTLCLPPSPGAPAFLVGAAASASPGLIHVPAVGHDLRPALAGLHAHGIASLLVEGGPTLLQAFLAQGLFDRISLFIRAADAAAALACARRHLPGLPADLLPRHLGAGFLLEATALAVRPAPPVRFVLFAAPRTGSNLLCGLLNAHPDILCHHGLFNPGGIHWARGGAALPDYPGGVGCRDADPAGFLRHVWSLPAGQAATGFKLNRDEDEGAVSLLLRDRGVRKILLRRRNRVRTYVSERVARQTGIWESYERGALAAAPLPRLRLDPADLLRHAALNAAYYAQLEAVMRADGQGWLDVFYEDLAQPGELARILTFLGQPLPAQLPSICHKRGPADLATVVENLDALRHALAGSDLADDLLRPDLPDLKSHAFMPEETFPCPMPASPPALTSSPAIAVR
jgi:riboflavin biosynthesis pyrimidine reductase